MNEQAPATKATYREWLGLGVLALPCIVYSMDLTVLNLALPAICTELQPSSAQVLWIVDVYGFLVAGFLITMGTLGDRVGRRRVLLIGAAAFGVASTVAACSNSAAMLIAMRAVLGIAGATLAPSTLSLLRNMFHDEAQRRFAIGVWIASFSLGGAIGPLVGGLVIEWFAWGAVFLIAVPVMLVLLLLGPFLLPEYRDPDAGRLDPGSVLLSLAAVLTTIYGLKQVAEHGATLANVAIAFAGIGLGAVFVRRQAALAHPLLDLSLFHRPAFRAAIAAYSLACLAMFGVYIFITQYLQLVLGLTPLQAGIATVPWGLSFVIGSLLAPRLAARVPPPSIIVWGLVVAAAGFLLLTFAGSRFGLAAIVAGTVVMSAALAPVFTLSNEMIITAAPPERAGSAAAVSETGSEFSGALGIAVLGSLGTVVYRSSLAQDMPDGVPPEAASRALSTLGGAVTTATELPEALGVPLLQAARAAFVDALQLAAVVSAVVLLAASVQSARVLRHLAPAKEPAVA